MIPTHWKISKKELFADIVEGRNIVRYVKQVVILSSDSEKRQHF